MKYILLVLLLTGRSVQAQDTIRPVKSPRVIIKFSPLMLLNYDPTIQGAVEVMIARRQSIQGEFGYSRMQWGTSDYRGNNVGQREYWRAKAEYRWYGRSLRNRAGAEFDVAPAGNYYAIEGYFKQINGIDAQTIGRDCVNGPCAYYEKLNSPVSRFVEAFYVKYGRQMAIARSDGKPSHFLFDIAVGVGLRGIQVTRYDPDRTGESWQFSERFFSGGNRFNNNLRMLYPDVTLNLKVGYTPW